MPNNILITIKFLSISCQIDWNAKGIHFFDENAKLNFAQNLRTK